MNELKNLTNFVIEKFGKLIIIVQVRYITIEIKEVSRIGYNAFLFPQSYSGEGLGATLYKR